MGYAVLLPHEQVFAPPSWDPESARQAVELREVAVMRHSQANLWRYPPGAAGRRHREPIQEEVFCVLEGTLTMFLGEPPERFELSPGSVVVVEPGTALEVCNQSDSDVVFFAYGAPSQPSDYNAEKLQSARPHGRA